MRHLTHLAVLAVVALAALALADPAEAAEAPAENDPLAWLAAPADPLDYHRRSERASQLVGEQKWAEAEALLRELVREYPFDSSSHFVGSSWGRLAFALRKQGKHRESIAAYERVLELQGLGLPYESFNAPYWIAAAHLALGEKEAALAALERLVMEERYLRRSGLAEDPAFAALKDDPRFLRIAGREAATGAAATPLDRVAGWRRDIDHLVAEIRS